MNIHHCRSLNKTDSMSEVICNQYNSEHMTERLYMYFQSRHVVLLSVKRNN